jgi:hypothetical protein
MNFLSTILDTVKGLKNNSAFDHLQEKNIPNHLINTVEDKNSLLEIPKNFSQINFSNPKPDCRITSPFGWRVLTFNGIKNKNYHTGIDLAGSGICHAVEDCKIEKIVSPDPIYPSYFKWDSKLGWVSVNAAINRAWTPYISLIGLYTNNRYTYKHVQIITPPLKEGVHKVGDTILSGTPFCQAGQLGFCMGAHLHFEVQLLEKGKYPNYLDPEKFLKEKGLL